jgi:hypothetical protein
VPTTSGPAQRGATAPISSQRRPRPRPVAAGR